MSASVASSRSANQRSTGLLPAAYLPLRPVPTSSPTYTRPADWLAMPTLAPGTDRKIHMLAAVYDNGSNLYALQCATTSGTYTVDWGDGLGTQTYTSGTTASYNIAWSNISAGTLTTGGYRQAMITITPTTAGQSLTQALFNVRGANDTSTAGNAHNFLEASLCDVGLARISFGPGAGAPVAGQAYNPMLEQVNLIQTAAAITATGTTFDYMFSSCGSLQSVTGTITGATTGAYSATGMFEQCSSLITAPSMNMPKCTFQFNMFSGCIALRTVNLDLVGSDSTVTNWGQAFNGCRSLQTAPRFPFNGATSESWANIFNGCNSLISAPWIDASNPAVTSVSQMFSNCNSLRNAPFIRLPTSGSYAAVNMFSGCTSLVYVPDLDWSRCNSLASTFSGCSRLQRMGNMNIPLVSTMNSTFAACSALKSVGTITAGSALTTMASAFANCTNLESVGAITGTTNVTSCNNMFENCRLVTQVPALTLPLCTQMISMFQGCFNLRTAPAITIATAAVASTQAMFQTCWNLISVPNYTWTFAAGSAINVMFNQCASLRTPPSFANSGTVANWNGMFANCTSLETGGSWTTTAANNMGSMFENCRALKVAPVFSSTANVTTVTIMFRLCDSLAEIPAYNLTGVNAASGFTNFVSVTPSLRRSRVTNTRFSISYAQCTLAGAQLDEIYTNLPTITAQTITVTGNWGTATDTPSIATAQGWTVTGS